jgi:hypothetical protein
MGLRSTHNRFKIPPYVSEFDPGFYEVNQTERVKKQNGYMIPYSSTDRCGLVLNEANRVPVDTGYWTINFKIFHFNGATYYTLKRFSIFWDDGTGTGGAAGNLTGPYEMHITDHLGNQTVTTNISGRLQDWYGRPWYDVNVYIPHGLNGGYDKGMPVFFAQNGVYYNTAPAIDNIIVYDKDNTTVIRDLTPERMNYTNTASNVVLPEWQKAGGGSSSAIRTDANIISSYNTTYATAGNTYWKSVLDKSLTSSTNYNPWVYDSGYTSPGGASYGPGQDADGGTGTTSPYIYFHGYANNNQMQYLRPSMDIYPLVMTHS